MQLGKSVDVVIIAFSAFWPSNTPVTGQIRHTRRNNRSLAHTLAMQTHYGSILVLATPCRPYRPSAQRARYDLGAKLWNGA